MGEKFSKQKCGANLRQAQQRLNIHRGKKLGGIAKNKDSICKHLDAGQEVNAKIWCETLINDENLMPCYDVIHTMCDQVNGRLNYIEKYGAPKDMNETFATIIHSAPKMDVQELMEVRKQLALLLDESFVKECNTNPDLINKVVRENIDFKKPEDGEIGLRMVNLAKERNVQYSPSMEMVSEINAYCSRKMIPVPQGLGGPDAPPIPQYQPQPMIAPMNVDVPPQNPGMPPPGYNPGGQMPPPGYNPGGGDGFGGPGNAPVMAPPQMPPQMPPPQMQPQQPNPYPQQMPQYAPDGQNPVMPDPSAKPQGDMTGVVEGMPVMPPGQGQPPVDDFQARLDALNKM